jgi:methylated-DNA-[protein]-cysteine S-methyltransferase
LESLQTNYGVSPVLEKISISVNLPTNFCAQRLKSAAWSPHKKVVQSMKREKIKSEEDVIKLLRNKTEFERAVLVATFKIPKGKVSTYKRIAENIGRPRAYRAVGNALHKNPLAPIVPCHRVVRSDGGFGGEKKGAESRRVRLEREGIPVERDKVKMSEEMFF